MQSEKHTPTPQNSGGIMGCILLIALLVTTVIALILGTFVSGGLKNPIEDLMLGIRDGFTEETDDKFPDDTDDWFEDDDDTTEDFETSEHPETSVTDTDREEPSDTSSDTLPDDSTTEPGSQTTPDDTTSQDTSAPPTTTEPPVTTQPPETTKPAETTKKPDATTPPKEPDPPVSSSPVTDEDRVNDPNYFHDVLFIGDSRTVGLSTYGKIEGATYFARTSMNVANAFADKKSETEKSGLNLTEFLTKYKFGKIYIMLGINEIGYSYKWITTRYEKIINQIKELQPEAIIIIQGNMHVTQKKSDANPDTFNNKRINELNRRLSKFADNKTVFYVDFNEAFDDENGALNATYTGDGVHLRGKYYSIWRDWIFENGRR